MLFEVPGLNLGAPKTDSKKSESKHSTCDINKVHKPNNKKDITAPSKNLNAPKTKSKDKSDKKHEAGLTWNSKKEELPPKNNASSKMNIPNVEKQSGKSKLQQKMEEKLRGARFRYLNQKLYQIDSREALDHFKEHPEDFEKYHEGFRSQVVHWPVNPVDVFIEQLERDVKQQKLIAADMGCGEAKIMRHFLDNPQFKDRIKVHSFDLAASHPDVVVSDMSKVPLQNGSCDVVIFCLSLMNTNFIDAIREAKRILKPKTGLLRISEVESRFDNGPHKFIAAVEEIGFKKKVLNTQYKVFTMFEFIVIETQIKAQSSKPKDDKEIVLKPCLYKKR